MQTLLSIKETAAILGISPWTVRSYLVQGKLIPVRIGRRVLFEQTEIERFINEAKSLLKQESNAKAGESK